MGKTVFSRHLNVDAMQVAPETRHRNETQKKKKRVEREKVWPGLPTNASRMENAFSFSEKLASASLMFLHRKRGHVNQIIIITRRMRITDFVPSLSSPPASAFPSAHVFLVYHKHMLSSIFVIGLKYEADATDPRSRSLFRS